MDFVEKFYEISWGRLATLETDLVSSHTEGQTTPILAFHGWLDNAASFIPLMEALPNEPWISVDLAGHGHSDPRPGGNMRHFLSYVQDIWELMEQLAYPRVRLIGHSLGSGVASIIAATWPERVEKLVLVDGMGPFSVSEDSLIANLANSFDDLKNHLTSATKKRVGYADIDQAASHLRKQRRWPLEPDSAKLLAKRMLREDSGKFFWTYDAQLKLSSALPFSHRQVNEIYANIQAPTLVLRFSNGPMYLPHIPWGERIAALNRLKMMDFEGGHHLHMDQTALLAPHIEHFISAD